MLSTITLQLDNNLIQQAKIFIGFRIYRNVRVDFVCP